jgi:hypothetical protein
LCVSWPDLCGIVVEAFVHDLSVGPLLEGNLIQGRAVFAVREFEALVDGYLIRVDQYPHGTPGDHGEVVQYPMLVLDQRIQSNA